MALSDDWMKQTGGGKRTSPYSEPPKPKKKRKTWLERFREESAGFQRKRIDEMTK